MKSMITKKNLLLQPRLRPLPLLRQHLPKIQAVMHQEQRKS
jgi:hypothetical protein